MIRKQTARTRSRGICIFIALAMLVVMPTSIHATESGAAPETAASLNVKWEALERKAEDAFIKGDLELSRKSWQEAARFAEQEKSQELNLATTLNQLNHLYTRTGEYEKSFTNLHRALDIRQRLLKRDDVLIAETMGNLAIVCDALHRRHEAEEWFQKSLEIKRAVLKPDAPELAVTMHNLARLYAGEKRYKESIELLNQALDIDQKHYGEKHIEIVRDLTTLGISCYECQEFDEAIKYLERALALANELKDDRKHDLIPIHHYLGLSCAHTKQHEKAHKHYTSAFELGKHVHGEGHHKNTPALLNLAKGNDQLGKTDAALALYKEAVAIEEKRSPKDEYLLTDCLVELGHFYQSHNQVKEAESAYRKAFASYETLPHDAKRRLYELPVSLSALLRKQGKNEEAEEVSRRYLHVHTPHGEEHFKL
ncbi:MAG: tetratricopeptide repeat protein [Candidatus Obscuribacterales bacterium]|nr:tetratricopeptide repeat protein [Candidatus Obscuribacterales bacterium]